MQLTGTRCALGLALAVLLLQPSMALGTSYTWTSPDSGAWTNSANWTPAGAPGGDPADTAAILATGHGYKVTFGSGGIALGGFTLNSADASLDLSGATMTVNGAASLQAGTLALNGSIWTGSGTLTNGAAITVAGNSQIQSAFVQNGTLTIQGEATSGILATPNGFTNSGTISLTSLGSVSDAVLAVNGTLTNGAGGRVETLAGSGGTRVLAADIANSGTVSIGQATTIDRPSAQLSNSGTWTVVSGAGQTMASSAPSFTNTGTLNVSGVFEMSGPAAVFNQNAGTLTVGSAGALKMSGGGGTFTTNGGTLTIAAGGTFEVSGGGGTFRQTAGALNATGQMSVTNGMFSLEGGTISTVAPILIAGGTLNLNAPSAGAAAFTVYGMTNFGLGGGGAIGAGQVVTIESQGGPVNTQALLISSGAVTNDGTISLTSVGSSASDAVLAVNGTLTNGAGGRIETLAGSGGTRILAADIANSGTVSIGQTTLVDRPSAQLSNSGTWTVVSGAGQTMASSAPSFTNTGTLNVSGVFEMSGPAAVFNQNAGTLTVGSAGALKMSGGGGTFTTNGGTLTIAAGGTFEVSGGGGTFRQTAGALNATGQMSVTNGMFSLEGGTISTVAPILIAGGTLNLNAPSAGAAAFTVYGMTNFGLGGGGAIGAGQVVTIESQGGPVNTQALLISSGAVTNDGTISLTSVGSSASDTVLAVNGTFINGPTGRLETLAGSGGTRIVSANIDNQGLIRIDQPTDFQKNDAVYTNSGTILANSTATFHGASFTNAPGGRIGGSGTLDLTNLTAFTNNGIMAPGSSPGLMTVTGPYVQGAAGVLEIEVGGATKGTQYDCLAITGAATLAGFVDMSLVSGYVPTPGDTFEVLTAAGGVTDGGLALAPGDVGTWLLYVGSNSLKMEFVPEPATLCLVAAGGLAMFFKRRRSK